MYVRAVDTHIETYENRRTNPTPNQRTIHGGTQHGGTPFSAPTVRLSDGIACGIVVGGDGQAAGKGHRCQDGLHCTGCAARPRGFQRRVAGRGVAGATDVVTPATSHKLAGQWNAS